MVEYAINREYIAEVLCINREKPAMECEGKCHLMSSLEKEYDNDNPAAPNPIRIQLETTVIYVEDLFSFTPKISLLTSVSSGWNTYRNTYRFTGTMDIFHPPRLV